MRTRFKSKKEYKDFYEENGYVVFEGLIPEKSIDKILIALEKFKKRRLPY